MFNRLCEFKRKSLLSGSVGLSVLLGLTACSGEEETNAVTENASNNEESIESAEVVLNWFPKSQQGGVFAAQEKGFFTDNGLDVEISPGGPGVSSIQIVASGNAEFGLAHADQIVIARNEGIELVTLAAVMQNSPATLMFHEGEEITDFEDLNGRNAYIQAGIPYWEYLTNSYDLSDVTELGYTGQHVNFIEDPTGVSQAFETSEPYFLDKEGIATETMLVSESGFDPYNVVLFVPKDYLEENKETVQKFTSAFVEGWEFYEESPYEINEVIHEANPDLAVEDLKFETDSQEKFIYSGDAEEHGFGHMTEERWQTLIDQLVEIEMLDEGFDPNEIFTTEFLN
ncbi:ABC transporter substrate-binding protein [Salipaludibacillus sp. CF4.18]|uniref:ABC transporter substrate-binding protein n=1 Tax=Salipaludibacillus sp. CF4.18 TaxID=3373081 RepID=UPI003EE7676B